MVILAKYIFDPIGCPIEIFSHITDLCLVTEALPERDDALSPLEITDPVLVRTPVHMGFKALFGSKGLEPFSLAWKLM